MKKVYLVSVWVYTKRTRPVELDQHFVALRAVDHKAAQRNARRKFLAKGYDVDVSCVEAEDENLDKLIGMIQQSIANCKAKIAETEKLSDAEITKLGLADCARKLLDYTALKTAEKKLAALVQSK